MIFSYSAAESEHYVLQFIDWEIDQLIEGCFLPIDPCVEGWADDNLVDSDLIGGSGFRKLSTAGRDILRTLSRMICRIVFKKALRNSDVLKFERKVKPIIKNKMTQLSYRKILTLLYKSK